MFKRDSLTVYCIAYQDHQCCCCKREQIPNSQERYLIEFQIVHSRNILTQGRCRFKLDHLFGSIGRRGRELNLCKECKCYLADRENDPKNLWPIFLYSVLFGTSQGVFLDSVHHYSVCGAETLWRLIPQSMRPWWTSEIAKYDAYNSCTIESPAAVFEDKTLEFLRYNNDFNSGQLSRVCEAMRNNHIIDRNVLCPWSCSTSCKDAGRISLDILIQRMIPMVNLTMYSPQTGKEYVNVHWCSNCYFRVDDGYATIMLNPEWKVKPTLLIENGCLQALTCKFHDGGEDKMVLHAPQSPHDHILNAEQSDQLAPCVRKHRVAKPMVASEFCTKFAMYQQRSEYAGVSTMDLTSHSDFSRASELRYQHEAASIVGRDDIVLLLNKKVTNGEISPEHAENIKTNARLRFNDGVLRQHTQGST